jgi:hypothetical protein
MPVVGSIQSPNDLKSDATDLRRLYGATTAQPDDDHRDVPEQRYARRATQAVCRRELA